MTAQGEDILAWLDSAIREREEVARAAHATDPSPWTAEVDSKATFDHARDAGSGLVVAANGNPLWDCEGASSLCMTAAASRHAALNDPESVLRRCAADRRLIAEHGPFSATDSSCKGCGLDNHEELLTGHYGDCPVLLAIAEGYGWTGGEQ